VRSVTIPARSNDKLASERSVGHTHTRTEEGLLFLTRANPLVVRALDGTNQASTLSTIEDEAAPKLATAISKRKASSRKKRPAKGPSKKRPAKPTKRPSKKKPPKKPSKKKPGKGCSRKESANGSCGKSALKLEFTKYPKGKQHWTPPKAKKPAAERRLDLTAVIHETKALTLEKRAPVTVAEGATKSGKAADEMRTWHVINCIAIAGYDNASGAKAMAHINGINRQNEEYDKQFADFADIVYSWKGPIEISVRWPHTTAIPSDRKDLKKEQKELEADIKKWVTMMRDSTVLEFKISDRHAKRREGDMIMTEHGDVAVDT
jgi:hypothetical protein